MKFFTSALITGSSLISFAQAGSLDPTFGNAGIVITDVDAFDETGNALAVQADGKIILAGSASGTYLKFAVARYNEDGSLDLSFDIDGKVTTDVGYTNNGAEDIAVQSDGKIIVVGSAFVSPGNGYKLARYNVDGSLDNSFDTDGIVAIDLGSSNTIKPNLLLQTDGKIVVTGSWNDGINANDFCVLRFNADGTPDVSFDGDGMVTTDFLSDSDDGAWTALIQPDGKIVLAGTNFISGSSVGITMARYNNDGSLDNTFSADGMVTTNGMSYFMVTKSIALLPGGQFLLSGVSYNGVNFDFTFARFNSDGSIDPTFGTGGLVTIDHDGGDNQLFSAVVQTDGKIVFAGNTESSALNFFVMRLNADGSPDNTFSADGSTTTPIQSDDESVSVALQSDGKIVLGGTTSDFVEYKFALTRYTGGPFAALDNSTSTASFNLFPNPSSGNFTITTEKELSGASVKILDPEGRIIYEAENLSGRQFQFDLSHYNNAIYFVQIYHNGMTEHLKLVKN